MATDTKRQLRSPRIVLRRPKFLHRPQKRPKGLPKLASSRQLLIETVITLWRNKKVLFLITLVYAVLDLFLVHGFTNAVGTDDIRAQLGNNPTFSWAALAASANVFATLASSSSSTNASEAASAYQTILLVIVSLAVIWTLRQAAAKHKVSFKMAYYRGLYPLAPFFVVAALIAIRLIPAVVAFFLYQIVAVNGIVVNVWQLLLLILILAPLVLWSIRMLLGSLMALYIVTLPEMTPVKAIRTSNKLVRWRRWNILRKMIVLSIVVVVVITLIMLPLILFYPPAAPWTIYGLTIFVFTIIHTFMYSLYRNLVSNA